MTSMLSTCQIASPLQRIGRSSSHPYHLPFLQSVSFELPGSPQSVIIDPLMIMYTPVSSLTCRSRLRDIKRPRSSRDTKLSYIVLIGFLRILKLVSCLDPSNITQILAIYLLCSIFHFSRLSFLSSSPLSANQHKLVHK